MIIDATSIKALPFDVFGAVVAWRTAIVRAGGRLGRAKGFQVEQYFGLRPHEVMMVAAHKYDLKAAKAAGMRTAFIKRPLEYGNLRPDFRPEPYIDMMAVTTQAWRLKSRQQQAQNLPSQAEIQSPKGDFVPFVAAVLTA